MLPPPLLNITASIIFRLLFFVTDYQSLNYIQSEHKKRLLIFVYDD